MRKKVNDQQNELALVLEDQEPVSLHVRVLVIGKKPEKKLWTPNRHDVAITVIDP